MQIKDELIDEILSLQKDIGKTSYTREQLEIADIMHLVVVKGYLLDVLLGKV